MVRVMRRVSFEVLIEVRLCVSVKFSVSVLLVLVLGQSLGFVLAFQLRL